MVIPVDGRCGSIRLITNNAQLFFQVIHLHLHIVKQGALDSLYTLSLTLQVLVSSLHIQCEFKCICMNR